MPSILHAVVGLVVNHEATAGSMKNWGVALSADTVLSFLLRSAIYILGSTIADPSFVGTNYMPITALAN